MGLPEEIDDYIKETIDYTLGLPISARTLELKLQAYEKSQKQLRDQYFLLRSKLKEKDEIIQRARSEATMNAQALKKSIGENQRLASECANLQTQCTKWQNECSLYDHDREVLMDFGNEADERAKDAERRALLLEEELRRMSEELLLYKQECDINRVGSSTEGTALEQHLLEALLATLIRKDQVVENAYTFLEANSGFEPAQQLLELWRCLSASTRNILSMAAEVMTLEKVKEHLRSNLDRAENEVKILFEENKLLNEENKRLARLCAREWNHSGSGGKHAGTASAKGNKRKSSPKTTSSPVDRKIDFSDPDSPRRPLSPLQFVSSPDLRKHKK